MPTRDTRAPRRAVLRGSLAAVLAGASVVAQSSARSSAAQAAGTAAPSDGVVATTRSSSYWGLRAGNLGSTAGAGGAVRAEGGLTTGLYADTGAHVTDVPALVAVGGDGGGTAQVARGTSYLDGDACLLRAWVGVAGVSGEGLAYAPLASAERAQHLTNGRLTLPVGGTASVVLPGQFVAACDLSTLVVSVTAIGAAMSGLYVTTTSTGFIVHGGVKGAVFWTASADRTAMDLPKAPAPPSALSLVGHASAPSRTRAGQRLRRAALRLPS